MINQNNIRDFKSILVHIHGPLDEDIYRTAKFESRQYKELLEKLYKHESSYEFSEIDKSIIIDALRMFLEGISEGDVTAVTGNDKAHYLNLYGALIKEWGIIIPKLKRDRRDSTEYSELATKSGLVED